MYICMCMQNLHTRKPNLLILSLSPQPGTLQAPDLLQNTAMSKEKNLYN